MDPTPATRDALLSAVNALVCTVPPAAIIPRLRQLLHHLTADEQPSKATAAPVNTRVSTAPRKPSPKRKKVATPHANGAAAAVQQSAPAAEWPALRDQLCAACTARGVSRRELAAALGMTHGTIRTVLAPSGHMPSNAMQATLRRWLDQQPAEVAASGAATFPVALVAAA